MRMPLAVVSTLALAGIILHSSGKLFPTLGVLLRVSIASYVLSRYPFFNAKLLMRH